MSSYDTPVSGEIVAHFPVGQGVKDWQPIYGVRLPDGRLVNIGPGVPDGANVMSVSA